MSRHDFIKLNCLALYSLEVSRHDLELAPSGAIEKHITRELALGLGAEALAKATVKTADDVEREVKRYSAEVYILSIEDMQAYRHSIIQETIEQLSEIAGANKPSPEEKNDE